MKKIFAISLCAILFCLLFCGCFDDSHHYNYDYESMVRYLKNCDAGDVDEYFYSHYSLNDVIEMYGKDAIMDYAVGSGWVDEWYEEIYN